MLLQNKKAMVNGQGDIIRGAQPMIEVFRTNVNDLETARRLVEEIHKNFSAYRANFDLLDRDKILRVVCKTGHLLYPEFTSWLQARGCLAEALPD